MRRAAGRSGPAACEDFGKFLHGVEHFILTHAGETQQKAALGLFPRVVAREGPHENPFFERPFRDLNIVQAVRH